MTTHTSTDILERNGTEHQPFVQGPSLSVTTFPLTEIAGQEAIKLELLVAFNHMVGLCQPQYKRILRML